MQEAIVVGGSLAGLMAAIVLRSQGYKVHILERSSPEALQSQAAGICAGQEVQSFIQTYVENCPEYAIVTDLIEEVDGKGVEVKSYPPTSPMNLTTWKKLYDILKGALIEERDGVPSALYETRKAVKDVRDDGKRVAVTYEDLITATSRTLQTDLVIAADGANSTVRGIVSEKRTPKYAGYVTWRGRVPEAAVSVETREGLRNRCVVMRVENGYLVSYYVPADTGNQGECEFVWIWYDMLPESSSEFEEAFTDIDGEKHFTTIPRGRIQPSVWARKLNHAKTLISQPHFLELFEKTDEPFVSAIRDLPALDSVFCDGKVLLVGDALASYRPHAGGAVSQAALQAIGLASVFSESMTLDQWQSKCVWNAKMAAAASSTMGEYFFHGKMPSEAPSALK